MPELGEVEFFRKQWAEGIGDVVRDVRVNGKSRIFRDTDPRRLSRSLQGEDLRQALAHGKRLLFRFGEEFWLELHLGMTGRLLVGGADFEPEKHDHLALRQGRGTLVFRDPRMFGRAVLHRSRDVPKFWRELPPAVLSEDFSKPVVREFLRRRKGTPLKALLLDQSRFPGIGNWMADEILWRSGFHPAAKAGELDDDESARLWREIRTVSRGAMRTVGVDWSDPPDGWLFQHRWKPGGSCPRCGEALLRDQVGGRTTCWCPVCQAS